MSLTLGAAAHSELNIRKSRFVGCVQPVQDRAGAQRIVAELRLQHPDATHVCWAFMAGGKSAANDDGEPGGTAGRPMLDVLRHHALEGVLATVVRYFGGIKLGAGGLMRAYTEAVAQALAGAPKLLLHQWRTLACDVPYALEGALRREIAAVAGASLKAVEHGALVSLVFQVIDADAVALMSRIDDISHGRAGWRPVPPDGGWAVSAFGAVGQQERR